MVRRDATLSRLPVVGLRLDFVEGRDDTYAERALEWTEDDIAETEEEIRRAWAQITDMEFWRGVLGR